VDLGRQLWDRVVPHVALDSDNENSTLQRFHPDAGFIDLDQPRALDDMFRALDRTGLVVVDCRAASTEVFLDYCAASDLLLPDNARTGDAAT
jgi:hypothetical protein